MRGRSGKRHKKSRRGGRRPISRKRCFVRLAVRALLALLAGYLIYTYVWRPRTEPETEETATNTDPILTKTEDSCRYAVSLQLPEIAERIKKTYVIPGLRATRSLKTDTDGIAMCTTMTPQGMTVTEKYIFISAYCHHQTHNSVLYMLDRATGAFIKEIVLQGRDHCGGMAYDPVHKNVWVSGGTTGAAKAIAYGLEDLEAYSLDETEAPITPKYRYTLATITRNSYMNYADDALMIGYFTTSGLSQLQWLDLTEEGGLHAQIIDSYDSRIESVMADYTTATSGRVQGVCYYEADEPYLMLDKSFGIYDSALQFYEFESNQTGFTDNHAVAVTRMPMKMEQITEYGGQLYCLFESAAYPYRTQFGVKLDRILVFNMGDLLPENEEPVDIAETDDET